MVNYKWIMFKCTINSQNRIITTVIVPSVIIKQIKQYVEDNWCQFVQNKFIRNYCASKSR